MADEETSAPVESATPVHPKPARGEPASPESAEGVGPVEREAPPEVVTESPAVEASSPSETVTTPAVEPSGEPAAAAPQPPASPVVETPVIAAPVPSPNIVQELLIKARAAIQQRKQKKLERSAEQLNRNGKVTNADVQKLLRVSKPTATRYLSILEKEGRLRQVGNRGKAVSYLKAK